MRMYYLKEALEQFYVVLEILWKGVILNKGHHSEWYKTWFFGNDK